MFNLKKQQEKTNEKNEIVKAMKQLTKAVNNVVVEQKKTNDYIFNLGYMFEKHINEQNQMNSIIVNDTPAILSTTEKKIVDETATATTTGFKEFVLNAVKSKSHSRDYALHIQGYEFKKGFMHEGINVSEKIINGKLVITAFISKSKNMRPAQIRKICRNVVKQIKDEEGIKITVGEVKD